MIKVNLLSPERKEVAGGKGPEAPSFDEERQGKISIVAVVVAILLTVGIIGYLYYTQTQTIDEKNRELSDLTIEKQKLDDILKEIELLNQKNAELKKKIGVINGLKARQQDCVKMMDELLNSMPEWVWITSLSFTNRTLVLNGKTLGNNLISEFISNLKGTDMFVDIDFPGSNRQKEGVMDVFIFSLKCRFKDKETETNKVKEIEKDKKAG